MGLEKWLRAAVWVLLTVNVLLALTALWLARG